MNTDELLAGFNQPQRDAVLYCDGPSLVIAGAGSGKTRVLTYKIAYLLSTGYDPWTILALTFTNKAADEMKHRIARIVGEDRARYLWMGTFHSIFLRILRIEHDRIGFSSNFTIYDASDSKSLIKSIIKEMQLDDKTYKASTVASRISMAKNWLTDADAYYADRQEYQEDSRAQRPLLRDIYKRYVARCRQSDAMDFDDILLFTYKLFAENPDILAKYENQFRYVLVDEYQDTNYAQHRIVWLLTQHHQNVCVVGDDAQSIYSFRGANIDNILKFNQLYTGIKTFKLEQNYRSTQMIVNAANSLIHHNRQQIFKNVFSELDPGEKIQFSQVQSDVVEGDFVTRRIQAIASREHLTFSDFAILYRTNAQSRIFEESLRKANIPYRIYGGLSFYQRKEIKDAIAYFRVAVNPHDEEALKRIINYPARGLGQTSVSRIIETAVNHEVSLWTVICSPQMYNLALSSGASTRLEEFRQLIQSFIDRTSTDDALSIGRYILEESKIIQDIYQDHTPENLSRQENIQELVNGMSEYVTDHTEQGDHHIFLADYLSEVSLISDLDSDKKDDSPKVSVMTVHSAKGLEFNTVFVVGMEEELFPSPMSSGSPRELEEERRLFYVALTRAKKYCFVTAARQRYQYGQMKFSTASRFIRDIDQQYIQVNSSSSESPQRSSSFSQRTNLFIQRSESSATNVTATQNFRNLQPLGHTQSPTSRFASSSHTASSSVVGANSHFTPGQRVHHDRFGNGVIERIEGSGEMAKAIVRFDDAGTKQLLLLYARLTSL